MARKNTQQAIEAWKQGRSYRASGRNGSPIWTLGGILYSYDKEIARFSQATDRRAIVNLEKYSVTTSCQQSGALMLMEKNGIHPVHCYTEQEYNRKRESDF